MASGYRLLASVRLRGSSAITNTFSFRWSLLIVGPEPAARSLKPALAVSLDGIRLQAPGFGQTQRVFGHHEHLQFPMVSAHRRTGACSPEPEACTRRFAGWHQATGSWLRSDSEALRPSRTPSVSDGLCS